MKVCKCIGNLSDPAPGQEFGQAVCSVTSMRSRSSAATKAGKGWTRHVPAYIYRCLKALNCKCTKAAFRWLYMGVEDQAL